MTTLLNFAAIMKRTTAPSWWYWGLTSDQVSQHLQQNKAMLTDICGYVDVDNTLKYVVAMEPHPDSQAWWWYPDLTGDQIGQYLTQNKAIIRKINAYFDTDHNLKFAVILFPAGAVTPYWYWGLAGDEVGQRLTQNKSAPTDLTAYNDVDGTLKFAVVMEPMAEQWWWYPGLSSEELGQALTQNRAGLASISAHIDSDNVLRFAAIMINMYGQDPWWYYGMDGNGLGQRLTMNKAQPLAITPYLMGSQDFGLDTITITSYPNVSGLNGNATLTINENGGYAFSGGWSPSNAFTGVAAQDVNLVMTVRDDDGTLWTWSTSGTVQVEGSYTFNYSGTNASIAQNWKNLKAHYVWHDDYNANLDLAATFNDIKSWYEQNKDTINEVIQVVGAIAAVA